MKKIPLTQGKFALVDDADYEQLMAMGKWCLSNNKYPNKTIIIGKKGGKYLQKNIKMHRFIIDAPDGFEVDHRDGNKLNNQKENLRICTHSQNGKNMPVFKNNTTGFKGVKKRSRKWVSEITADGKQIYLGYFTCPIEAARVYNAAAIKYHGEFANLNAIPQ